MPISIDFEAIAAAFKPQLLWQMNPAWADILRVAKWLSKRRSEARDLAWQSRGFPALRFYRGALTVTIDHSQFGSLYQPQKATFTGVVKASAKRFWQGLKYAGTAVKQELIMPRFLSAAVDTLAAILASMRRFSTPTKAMFDLTVKRTASDLIGQIAMFIRLSIVSLDDIAKVIKDAIFLKETVRELFKSKPQQSGISDQISSAGKGKGGLAQSLQEVGRWITGAILILPLLPKMIASILQAAALRFKSMLLTILQGIEAKVFAMRRQVIDLFAVDLRDMGRQAYDLLLAAQFIIVGSLDYYANFVYLFMTQTLTAIQSYLQQLSRFMQVIVIVVGTLRNIIETVLYFDLMPLILAVLPIPNIILKRFKMPKFYVIDLIKSVMKGAAVGGAIILFAIFDAAEKLASTSPAVRLIDWLTNANIVKRLRAGKKVFAEIFKATITDTYPAGNPPLDFKHITPFPDLYKAFMGGGTLADLKKFMTDLKDQLVFGLFKILWHGVTLLERIGSTFSQSARKASTLGSVARFRAMANFASNLAHDLYGKQAEELRKRIALRRDPFIEKFEGLIARGGFYLIGSVIPAYINELRQFWQQQSSRKETIRTSATKALPTSPHILAHRERLARVKLPRLTIRLPGRRLDDELKELTAVKFKLAIEQAYQTGLRQMATVG